MKTILLTTALLLLTTTLTLSRATSMNSSADLMIISTDNDTDTIKEYQHASDVFTLNTFNSDLNNSENASNHGSFATTASETKPQTLSNSHKELFVKKQRLNKNEWEGYFSGYIDLLTIINVNRRNIVTFGGNLSLGYQFNQHIYLGGGTSFYMYTYPTISNTPITELRNSYAIDFFGDIQVNFLKHTLLTPFIGLKTGVQLVPYYDKVTLCIRPSLGLSIRLPLRNELRVSLEYVPVNFFLNNCISINLGYKFGSN